jgi:hypothetical protein
MRVNSVAFAIIAALFQVNPCQADFWPDHAPAAFVEYVETRINTSHDPAVTGRTAPIVGSDLRTDAFGYALVAEALVPEVSDEIVVAALPEVPTDAGEVISRDILAQVLRAVARTRLKTDDEAVNRMLAAYLDEAAELTTGALPSGEGLGSYIPHEAEDAESELTTGSIPSHPAADPERAGGDIDRSLVLELPATI